MSLSSLSVTATLLFAAKSCDFVRDPRWFDEADDHERGTNGIKPMGVCEGSIENGNATSRMFYCSPVHISECSMTHRHFSNDSVHELQLHSGALPWCLRGLPRPIALASTA